MNLLGQSFEIGHIVSVFRDKERNNRKIKVEIYYPSDLNGDNVPLTTSGKNKFPVIGFGHGFLIKTSAYGNITKAIVPQGYILIFPKKERGLFPSHLNLAKDMAFVMANLYKLNEEKNSVFYDRIDSMNCVMGHSMGGGSAFVAAGLSPFIKAIVTLAPFETRTSAIKAAEKIKIPALIFAGENDCITPASKNQEPMYDALKSQSKTLITIKGGNHCFMANKNSICGLGEKSCNRHQTLSRQKQHEIINRYLIPWLNFQLKGDEKAGINFKNLLQTDKEIFSTENKP
ncbi:MAG: alpha/beta hydrolase [Bacteroidales bacterium]